MRCRSVPKSGALTVGPAFVDFMAAANEGRPVADFPRPAGILTVSVDPESGLLPWSGQRNAVRELFLEDMAPDRSATEPAAIASGATVAAPLGLHLPERLTVHTGDVPEP